MKKPSNELQELIKTLLPGEKKGFKVYCQSKKDGGTVDYLKLFGIYSGKQVLEDHQIQQQFSFKNFTRIKTYLYHQLLNYLAETASYSPEKELNNYLIAAETLTKKALYKQALGVLNKAKSLAHKFEFFHYCLHIDQRIYQVQNITGNIEYLDYYLNEQYRTEFKPMMDTILIEREIQNFSVKMLKFQVKKDNYLRTTEAISELDKTFTPLLKLGEDYPRSFIAKANYHTVAGYYYKQHKKFPEAIHHFNALVELYESSPHHHTTRYMSYLTFLGNLLYVYSISSRYVELKETIARAQNIQPKDKSHKIYLQHTLFLYECEYFKNCTQVPERKKTLKKIELEFLKSLKHAAISQKFYIGISLSVNYFIDGQFKKALEWLNRVDENSSHLNYKGFFSVIRIYRLVLYYEMGKTDLLQYTISNTYRSLQYSKNLFTLEKQIIKAIEKLIDLEHHPRERDKILENALSELNRIKEDAENSMIFKIFNFIGWIRCKLEKKNFHSLMIR